MNVCTFTSVVDVHMLAIVAVTSFVSTANIVLTSCTCEIQRWGAPVSSVRVVNFIRRNSRGCLIATSKAITQHVEIG